MLPLKIKKNQKFVEQLPIAANIMPLEVLSLDEEFITSGALDDINDVRQPGWQDNPKSLSYRGTFIVMGQVGVGTQWGTRNVITEKLWKYLEKYGIGDKEFYLITNALPTMSHTLGITTFAKAIREEKEERLNALKA